MMLYWFGVCNFFVLKLNQKHSPSLSVANLIHGLPIRSSISSELRAAPRRGFSSSSELSSPSESASSAAAANSSFFWARSSWTHPMKTSESGCTAITFMVNLL